MYDTESLNKSLNWTQEGVSRAVDNLRETGFAVMESVIPESTCDAMIAALKKIAEQEATEATAKPLKHGSTAKSISEGQHVIRNVVLSSPEIFMPTLDMAPVLAVLSSIIDDTVILDGSTASNALSVDDQYCRNVHIDSHLATPDPNESLDVVAFLCLNELTPTNGATKIWPKSHTSGIQFHRDPAYKGTVPSGHVELLAPKGSIAFVLGQTWHQIGENIDHADRWILLNHYKRWWIKPSTDFTKCGKKIFDQLTNNQKVILGFNSISPKDLNGRQKILTKADDIPADYDDALNN